MGRAILSGLTAPGVAVEGGIRVTNRSEARAAELADVDGVTAYATESAPDANRLAVNGAKLVIAVGGDGSVYVSADRNNTRFQGKPLPVIPGMQATVEIRTGDRSVLSYLLRPMMKSREALRER